MLKKEQKYVEKCSKRNKSEMKMLWRVRKPSNGVREFFVRFDLDIIQKIALCSARFFETFQKFCSEKSRTPNAQILYTRLTRIIYTMPAWGHNITSDCSNSLSHCRSTHTLLPILKLFSIGNRTGIRN